MFDPIDYGHAIRRLRGKRTQKDCADAGGIDRPTWNQYERGRTSPRGNYARVARGLGVDEDELTEAVIAAWRRRVGRDCDFQSPDPLPVLLLGFLAPITSPADAEEVPRVP